MKTVHFANFFLVAGTTLATLYPIRHALARAMTLPPGALDFVLYALITFFIAGMALHGINYLGRGLGHILERVMLPGSNLRTRPAGLPDLALIDTMSSEAFGAAASNLENIHKLFNFSDDIFWVVENRSNGQIVGYFCFFRLTRHGVDKIKDGTFHGPCPSEKSILNRRLNRCPVYIGALYGKTYKAKGFIVASLQSLLENTKSKEIYAKAATKDGARTLRRFGFKRLNPTASDLGSYFVKLRA